MVDRKLSELDEVTSLVNGDELYVNDGGVSKRITKANLATTLGAGGSPEGTAVLSTGEGGGTKFLREDGDGTSSWQTVSGATYVAPVVVTGTTDTLAIGDHATTNRYTNAAQVTVTLPTDAADDLNDGFWCHLVAEGAGGITLSTAGLTLEPGTPTTTVGEGGELLVQKTAVANTWLISSSGSGGDVVDDLTPQLGGDLDVNDKTIVAGANNMVDVKLGGLTGVERFRIYDSDDVLSAYINANGVGWFLGGLFADELTLSTGYIKDTGVGDVRIQLGDNAGSDTFQVRDSDLSIVFDVDSDGNVTADGTVDAVGQITGHTTINTQTGTTYTLVLADDGKIVEMNNASANTLTIPTNATAAFPIGTRIDVVQFGAGTTTIDPVATVTLNGVADTAIAMTGAQYAGASLYKRGTDEWVVIGALA